MAGSRENTLCIRYHRAGCPGEDKVFAGFDEDGLTPLEAEYYDDVMFYRNFSSASPVARQLIESGYISTVMKCNRIVVGNGKRDRFWLTK